MKALLIEFNLITGKRAGNIDPNDPALQCYGWQDIKKRPALEIRLIEDDRNAKQYEGLKGITVLKSAKEIDAKIDKLFGGRYTVRNREVFEHDLRRSKLSYDASFEELKAHNVRGIAESIPIHMEDLK